MNNFNPYFNQYKQPVYQPAQNGIVWVNGLEGAKAYQLVPNSNVILMDSERENVMYIKVADSVGMCSLRTFTYKEVSETASEYVTKTEMQQMLDEIREELKHEQFVPATRRWTESD